LVAAKRLVLGLGGAQVLLTALFFGIVALWLGLSAVEALMQLDPKTFLESPAIVALVLTALVLAKPVILAPYGPGFRSNDD